jgi:hypothetical protein
MKRACATCFTLKQQERTLQAGFQIRIQSGQWIQEGKMTRKSRKKYEISGFEVLDVLF